MTSKPVMSEPVITSDGHAFRKGYQEWLQQQFEASCQVQNAELQSARHADANAARSQADSSLQASLTQAASATPAEAASPAASLVNGQGLAGRGVFQPSNEPQMALSEKPKPGRGRSKAAVPLPEPSADLALQRALMEKPKPRPRPCRPPVTPQATGILSQTALTGFAIFLVTKTAGLIGCHGNSSVHLIPAAFHAIPLQS